MKDFKSALIFDGIAEALKNDGANLIQKVKGIFGFKVKGPNGNEVLWIVDAKNGSGKVEVNGKGTFFKIHTKVLPSSPSWFSKWVILGCW